ncbi:MAG: LysM peptidoglycan-binding domain-containing protein [Verrucomicrobiota bacterium]
MTAFSLRRRFLPIAAGLLSLFVASCSSTAPKSGYSDVVDYTSPNTGLSQEEYPFDKEGNYLADVVSGKKKGKPASSYAYSKPAPVEKTTYIDTYEKPVITAVDTPPEKPNPIYDRVPEPDSGNASYSGGGGSSSSSSKTKTTSSASASTSKTKSKTTTTTASTARKPAASKSKPKPVAVAKSKPQPKAKPKPAALTYKVKNGDTLYRLANRYNTSVAAIKQANGMSSNTLQNGRTLRIPRK